jgi:hypothetical protein
MVKVSAAYCNAVLFPPIVVAADYLGYVWVSLGCTWLLLFFNVLPVAAAVNVLAGAGGNQ